MPQAAQFTPGGPAGPGGRTSRWSLVGRLSFTLVVVAALCIVMIGLVSNRAMSSAERNRLHTSILADLREINDQMQAEYLSLVHISQQLQPSSSAGLHVEEYLQAGSHYEQIEASRLVSENINLVSFSNPRIELVEYVTPDGERLFSTVSSKASFSPFDLPVISRTADIRFQGIHRAGARFTERDVLSIIRAVEFSDGVVRHMYIEARTGIADSIARLGSMQDIPYSLLQIDEEGIVRHSGTGEFPAGSVFPAAGGRGEQTGRSGEYIWYQAEPIFGFRNVLLLPAAAYERESVKLRRDMLRAGCILVLLIFFLSLSLRRHFYRPLKTLEGEMAMLGRGDMSIRDYRFNIREYDSLFQNFASMKGQIDGLMADISAKEREKRQIELDKLYFQINPHFIMNALNSAQWQALMTEQPQLASYLSQLNYMLGYTLGKVGVNTTLRSELQVLEAYLELQQSRHDFQVHMEVEEGLYLDRPSGRLILQPVAENALSHNIDEFGNLWVCVGESEGQGTRIVIRDDGSGFDAARLSFRTPPARGENDSHTNRGIGLRYVWLTIQSFYGDGARMEVESARGEGTTVTLFLPHTRRELPGEEAI